MNAITSEVQTDAFIKALGREYACRNEALWTLLVADIVRDERRQQAAIEILCGSAEELQPGFAVALEGRPTSPRNGESNYVIDLAFGDIGRRDQTELGIVPAVADGWVCFCEAKVLADCSIGTARDPARNQLARVIESLLTFQRNGLMPSGLTFSLLTPRLFRDVATGARLYDYKYREYAHSKDAILRDMERSGLPMRAEAGWQHPGLVPRLELLRSHWATYEDIFALDDELGGIDVVDVARSGELPPVIARRMAAAAGRLQAAMR